MSGVEVLANLNDFSFDTFFNIFNNRDYCSASRKAHFSVFDDLNVCKSQASCPPSEAEALRVAHPSQNKHLKSMCI